MTKMLAILGLGLLLVACEAESDALEECSGEEESPCSKMVSCCDLVFAEDPSASSLAGESCLIDQSVALELYDQGNGNDDVCADMLTKSEYQELCFSCAADDFSSSEGDAESTPSEDE